MCERVRPFNTITSYRLAYPKCCGLANPDIAADLLLATPQVDSLSHYTVEMWDILTDVVLQEWFGQRLPPFKVPWGGAVYVPDKHRLLYCFDRSNARQAQADINRSYLSLDPELRSLSIFSSYGLNIPDDFTREREGLQFLARQADHLPSLDDYLFIVQDMYPDAGHAIHT